MRGERGLALEKEFVVGSYRRRSDLGCALGWCRLTALFFVCRGPETGENLTNDIAGRSHFNIGDECGGIGA
ncbi:MAG: hypothetical protein EBR99_02850, partial [Actinobacteria bacterium]|nr:hypothetical protein [Actinomycetota bacterium]